MDGQIKAIRDMLPSDEQIYSLAELFKMFGDPTRAKILECLQICSLNVGEIAEVLDMSVSAVSHQLRVLRSGKLVRGVKDGRVSTSLVDIPAQIFLPTNSSVSLTMRQLSRIYAISCSLLTVNISDPKPCRFVQKQGRGCLLRSLQPQACPALCSSR